MLTIRTNNVPREMEPAILIPANAQKDFDYLSEDERMESRIVQYKGIYYDVYDFASVNQTDLKGWDGVHADSYYSGVLVRMVDATSVVMGTYCY